MLGEREKLESCMLKLEFCSRETLSVLETLLTSAGWADDTVIYISIRQVEFLA